MRLLARIIGYGLIAIGFVTMVLDGARMVAGGPIDFTALRRLWALAHAHSLAAFERWVQALPLDGLWPQVVDPMLEWPAAAVGLGLGALLVWLGLTHEPRVGVLSRR